MSVDHNNESIEQLYQRVVLGNLTKIDHVSILLCSPSGLNRFEEDAKRIRASVENRGIDFDDQLGRSICSICHNKSLRQDGLGFLMYAGHQALDTYRVTVCDDCNRVLLVESVGCIAVDDRESIEELYQSIMSAEVKRIDGCRVRRCTIADIPKFGEDAYSIRVSVEANNDCIKRYIEQATCPLCHQKSLRQEELSTWGSSEFYTLTVCDDCCRVIQILGNRNLSMKIGYRKIKFIVYSAIRRFKWI